MLNQLVREYIEKKINTEFVGVEVYYIGRDLLNIILYDIQSKIHEQMTVDIPLTKRFPFYSLDSIIERLIYTLSKMRYYAK